MAIVFSSPADVGTRNLNEVSGAGADLNIATASALVVMGFVGVR